MKTIVYISEPMNGGILTYLEELTNSLCTKAHIYILYGNRSDTPKNLRQLFSKRITLINIPDFQRALNPVKDFKAYIELYHWIKRIHPDIIHLNSSKAGALGRLVIHHKSQKWFYTPHGYSFLMKNSSKIKRLIYFLIEWLFAKLGTTTVACGYGEYKIAHKLSKNSTYINNGVNVNALKRFWTRRSNTQDVFFTIGRINYQKNPRLFNQIALQFPNYKFIWFGDGPLKDELTADNIEITGWLPSNRLFKDIQPYKYFILCSRWEGLPMALLEAMYFKKYCCVTNVIGNRDLIKDSYTGLVFNNARDLYNRNIKHIFNEISTDYEYRQIIDYFNVFKMINKYKNIYNN